MNVVGPVNAIQMGLEGGNQVAYNVGSSSVAQTIKSIQGIAVGLQCLGAGGITFWDANVTGTSTNSTLSNALSITNQFYANSSVTAGQTLSLGNPCASGIAVSVSGAAATFAIRFA